MLNRYFGAIDDKRLDLSVLKATFLEDGQIARPDGSALKGWQNILDGQNKSFARFRGTHHVVTNQVVDIDNDIAELRANMTAMHLWKLEDNDPYSLDSHFVAGGVMTGRMKRTAEGWRFSAFSNRVVWRTGAFRGMMPGPNR